MEGLSLKDTTHTTHTTTHFHQDNIRHDAIIKPRFIISILIILIQSFLSLIVAYFLSHIIASFLITFICFYNGFHPEWSPYQFRVWKKPWESILAWSIFFAQLSWLLWYMQHT